MLKWLVSIFLAFSLFNYLFADDSLIKVEGHHEFKYSLPLFFIDLPSDKLPENLYWQVAIEPDFNDSSIYLSEIIPYTPIIQFSEEQLVCLNKETSYYFRVCSESHPWSQPHFFKVYSSSYDSLSLAYPLLSTLKSKTKAYTIHPLIPFEVWQKVEPYFLPVHHPIKKRLDEIFHRTRVTESAETFEKAGFGKPKIRKPTNIVVGRNYHFKNYIFKVFLDTQPYMHEWENWIQRIEGAKAIRACIKRHGFHHFVVPHKWIYPLPAELSSSAHLCAQRKHFILIVEKIDILSGTDNLNAFKKQITPSLLQELYIILTEEGLIDSVYPDNIPFTKKGQIAFVDTEHHHKNPVQYQKLTRFFSSDMQMQWKLIIEKNKF